MKPITRPIVVRAARKLHAKRGRGDRGASGAGSSRSVRVRAGWKRPEQRGQVGASVCSSKYLIQQGRWTEKRQPHCKNALESTRALPPSSSPPSPQRVHPVSWTGSCVRLVVESEDFMVAEVGALYLKGVAASLDPVSHRRRQRSSCERLMICWSTASRSSSWAVGGGGSWRRYPTQP